jgi:GR25 family glycosyltransferase involved in LPS biosynthesis
MYPIIPLFITYLVLKLIYYFNNPEVQVRYKEFYTPEEVKMVYQYTHTINQPKFENLNNLSTKNTKNKIKQFDDIQNIVFINLDERTDRKDQTLQEWSKFNRTPKRIQAVKFTPGSLGCSLSHIKALEYAKEKRWDNVLICEDDILFNDASNAKKQIDCFLRRHDDWDVLLLTAHIKSAEYIDSCSARVYDCWCTTAYLVRQEYYDILLHNFKYGARLLFSKNYTPVDVFWKSLQERDRWYVILPIIALQRAGSSDIHKATCDSRDVTIQSYLQNIRNYPENEQKKNDQMFSNHK